MRMAMLGFMVAAALFLGSASAASLGVVYTEGGMVQGKSLDTGFFRWMDVFKGIPFAAPPGRFAKPTRHPGWEGVLKTTEYSKRCLQVNLRQTDVRGSENCLYLNIWIPQGSKVSTGLPVMVWIYGGGYLIGGGQGANFLNNYLYDGQEIAERGNVIVVTFNYRLGALGLLSTGDSEIPGNYGLWDQHAAISWVSRNIAAFGGDPDNITVFGESAGSVSVNFQTLSPHNKGLFRRAISQSGVALCSWAVNENPRALAEQIAQKVNCPTDDKMSICLRATDPVALTLASHLNLTSSAAHPIVKNLVFSPVIDGDFVPDHPGNLFHNAADIDYIIGINSMDAHIFTGFDISSVNQPFQITRVEEMNQLLTALTEEKGKQAATSAINEYTASWVGEPSQVDIKKTIVEIETDYIFLVPTQAALHLHAKHAKTAKTYSYQFSEPTRMRLFPSWMGADHAEELQYVFGKPFRTPLFYSSRHRDLAGYLIAYWTNFARTGNPNSGESRVPVNWPPFTSEVSQYLDITHNMNRNSIKESLRARYVHFWTSTYAAFPSVNSTSV